MPPIFGEYSQERLKFSSTVLMVVGIVIAVVGILCLFFVLPLGIVIIAFGALFLFASKKQKDTAKKQKELFFEFPESVDGKRLLTVYDTIITGTTFEARRQSYIQELIVGERLYLEADEGNRHDPYAVKVLNSRMIQIGWIPKGRDVNSEQLQTDIFSRLTEGLPVYARVKKLYQLDKGGIGVVIYVARYSRR